MFAFRKAVPDVFAQADAELRRVAAFMDGTRPIQAVGAGLEFIEDAVVRKHLFHGDGRFDGLEVNEL
jgi:hypothetical protein